MITELSFIARPSNNKARHLFFALLISSVLVLSLSVALPPELRTAVLSGGMIFLIAALYVFSRFVGVTYLYDLALDTDGTPIPAVRSRIGKREVTLSRLTLATLTALDCLPRKARREYKTPDDLKRYNYYPTLDPERICLLRFITDQESVELAIEAPDPLINALTPYLPPSDNTK